MTPDSAHRPASEQYLTAYVNGHYIGVAIRRIQDVIGPQAITKIPRARHAIAGVLNLRGRIVTAIDMHERLEEAPIMDKAQRMGVIIDTPDELFSLLVDHVEDVKAIEAESIGEVPPTLNPTWQQVCSGVCQMQGRIMILLDIERVLDLGAVLNKARAS